MEVSEDLAFAMAMAIAENDSDSDSDDFQPTAPLADHRNSTLQRFSGSNHQPKRQKKNHGKPPLRQCKEKVSSSAPASSKNTKLKGRSTRTGQVCMDLRKPLTDIHVNKVVDDEKVNNMHQDSVLKRSEDMKDRQITNVSEQTLAYTHSNKTAELWNRSDGMHQDQALADHPGSDRLIQVQSEIREMVTSPHGGQYLICSDDKIISEEKKQSVRRLNEEVISLSEEGEQTTLGIGLKIIQNRELQIYEDAKEEEQITKDMELKLVKNRELQINEDAGEAEQITQDIELKHLQNRDLQIDEDTVSPIIINPESQLHALLQLCADTASDSEQIDPDDGCLGFSFVEVDDSIEAEEAIISLMTQSKSISNDDLNLGSEMDYHKGLIIENVDSVKIFQDTKIKNRDSNVNVSSEFLVDNIFYQSESFVKCPICQSCITDMSFEQRELHTNACLDNFDKTEALSDEHIDANVMFCNNAEVKAQEKVEIGECVQMDSLSDLAPVLRWLDTLNLSRYANIFIREEIDWDTFKCLNDEDLCTLGVTAFGPRKKILHSLKQLEQGSETANSTGIKHQGEINEQVAVNASGRKLITDFFVLPLNQNKEPSEPPVSESSSACKARVARSISARKRSIPSHFGGIPEWMCIPGTKFRVDAFQHLSGDCSHWFLTHFHTDHYQGLTRAFRYGHVYTSYITAQIVNTRIGIPWERLKPLPLNETVDIDGVKVTLLEAYHCPGSVMFLFEPQSGKAVLHTGDFRFCEEMASNLVLRNSRIHTLMLDTTYCNPKYDFPKQEVVIQFIIDAIQAEAFNPSTLFLIGTYTIGKERIFFEVAKALQKKIYVNAAKLRLLQCMKFSDEDMKWLTTNETDAHIHVVPLWSIASFKRMNYLSRHHHGRYSSIVSFSPTGWSFGRGKKRTPGRRWQQGTIIRYEAPYSEHCSFNELREFVRFINPVNIVPSVHNDSAESADALVALLLNEGDEGSYVNAE